MSRELVLFVVALSLGGASLTACGFLPAKAEDLHGGSGLDLEQVAWRRLWLPVLPALAVFAVLIGWASQEPPQTDELLTGSAALVALPLVWIAVRALVRAARALADRTGAGPAGTAGVLRPRVFVNDAFCAELDQPSLAATYAHEHAHARHRDPLRLWLAQLVTDLQWPSAAARSRLRAWRAALELARDEEARLSGIAGEDLAAAIMAAIRHQQVRTSSTSVSLTSADDILRVRIRRLLSPVPPRAGHGVRTPLLVVALLITCGVVGHVFGDEILRALPFISPS
jgi:hypothetical protein